MKRSLMMLGAAVLVTFALGGGDAFAQIKPQLPAPGEAPAGSPVAKYGWLTATGGYLRGSKSGSDNIQLKGMSLFWSNGGDGGRPFYNDNVVGWLAHDWQIDVIRAAMGTKKDEGGGNPGYCESDSAGQVGLVKTVVESSIMRGLYVLIDFHSHYADQYTACAQKFFRDMVNLYGKYPNVIYEIYNEPKTGWDAVRSYSNTVISTIRSTETSAGVANANLIVVGNPGWSSQPNVSGDVTDSKSNVAYSLHFYAATGAHDGYRGNATSAKNAGRTVFVTEFGTCDADGNGSVNTVNTDTWFTGTLDPNKISWVNWAVSNKDEAAAILKKSVSGTSGGWSSGDYSPSGTYIRAKFPQGGSRKYTVTLTQPATGGTITKEPSGNDHAYNSDIKVTAVPQAGWELETWTGDASGNAESVSGTIKGINLKISAVFYNGGLVKNGHFTYGTSSWSSSSNASLTLSQDNGQLKAVVSTPGTTVDGLRLTQSAIKLEAGRKYALSFKARGQSARTITPRVINNTGTRDFMDKTPINLTAQMQEFTREFSSDAALTNAILRFDCGNEAATWYLDDVKLLDKGPGTDAISRKNAATQRTAWSVVGAGSGATLRGPADADATVSLYDVRGKTVRSLAAKDGLTLGAGLPVGNYIAVIRNASGHEIYRAKVPITR
jgi:hypothetical protein